MNNIFSFRRFGLILSKDFQENWKKYVLQFLTLFGIMAVILTWPYYNRYQYLPNDYEHDNMQLLRIASFLFLGFGIFFASTMMDSMREKTLRISYLTIPVSNFEKFISRWLLVSIGYIIVFFTALWFADAFRVTVLSYKYPELSFGFLDFSKLINTVSNDYSNYHAFPNTPVFTLCISIYALFQSLFILGSTFWEKASFIKTFSAIAVIVLLFLFLNRGVIEISYNDLDSFNNSMNNITYDLSEKTVLLFFASIFGFFTLVNWVIAFFRFRESEIIKRF